MKLNLVQNFKNKLLTILRSHPQEEMSIREWLMTLPNVTIYTDGLDKSSFFNLEGECKELKIGKGVNTRKFCHFLVFDKASLIIGDNVFFNNFCSVNCLGKIEIGEGCLFGEGVKIYDHNHHFKFVEKTLNVARTEFTVSSVKIGKNCWFGSNVTILKNVEIGDNVIIGANCLIYKSIPSNSIVKHVENLEIRSN